MNPARPNRMGNGKRLRKKEKERKKKKKKKNHGEDLFTVVIFIIFVSRIFVFGAEAFSSEFWQR